MPEAGLYAKTSPALPGPPVYTRDGLRFGHPRVLSVDFPPPARIALPVAAGTGDRPAEAPPAAGGRVTMPWQWDTPESYILPRPATWRGLVGAGGRTHWRRRHATPARPCARSSQRAATTQPLDFTKLDFTARSGTGTRVLHLAPRSLPLSHLTAAPPPRLPQHSPPACSWPCAASSAPWRRRHRSTCGVSCRPGQPVSRTASASRCLAHAGLPLSSLLPAGSPGGLAPCAALERHVRLAGTSQAGAGRVVAARQGQAQGQRVQLLRYRGQQLDMSRLQR